jgi:hypothetical protein
VQPTALQIWIEVIILCTHINTRLLEASEAKSRECGELDIFPLKHRMERIESNEWSKPPNYYKYCSYRMVIRVVSLLKAADSGLLQANW